MGRWSCGPPARPRRSRLKVQHASTTLDVRSNASTARGSGSGTAGQLGREAPIARTYDVAELAVRLLDLSVIVLLLLLQARDVVAERRLERLVSAVDGGARLFNKPEISCRTQRVPSLRRLPNTCCRTRLDMRRRAVRQPAASTTHILPTPRYSFPSPSGTLASSRMVSSRIFFSFSFCWIWARTIALWRWPLMACVWICCRI